ncbi:hypothetical protein [Larkinella sp. VNQ87]|uniref:hypothetical protein n=1 Tax=Larkinella sp. VNQ87 TaxID=3400921 RepID=UPI003C2B0096
MLSELFRWIYEIVKSILLLPVSWVCQFTDSQEKRIEGLCKENSDELWTWTVLTALLPIITFLLAAFVNTFFIDYSGDIIQQLGKILNNGSLPIIAFGIVTSSVPYLVEKLKMNESNEEDEIFNIRKRIMAVATLLIFLTSGLFLLQSLSILTDRFQPVHHLISIALSFLLAIYCVVIGRKMFVLQTTKVVPNANEQLTKKTEQHNNVLAERYGEPN